MSAEDLSPPKRYFEFITAPIEYLKCIHKHHYADKEKCSNFIPFQSFKEYAINFRTNFLNTFFLKLIPRSTLSLRISKESSPTKKSQKSTVIINNESHDHFFLIIISVRF